MALLRWSILQAQQLLLDSLWLFWAIQSNLGLLHSPDCPLLQVHDFSFSLQRFKVGKSNNYQYWIDLWKSQVIVFFPLFPSCLGFLLRFCWRNICAFILKKTFHFSVSTDQVTRCHVWTPWRLRRETLTSLQKIVNCGFLLASNTFDSICMKTQFTYQNGRYCSNIRNSISYMF